MLNFPNRTGWGAFTGVWPHPAVPGRGDASCAPAARCLGEVQRPRKVQPPGVEPGPLAWRARILTVRPRLRLTAERSCCCFCRRARHAGTKNKRVSGLVVEWLPATESARVRFPAHADFSCQWRLSAPLAQWLARWTSNPKVAGSSPAGGRRGEVAERSKALRQGRNLFGGVGSNPTLVTFSCSARQSYPSG